jgi:alpha-1,6-mannosyltransferase
LAFYPVALLVKPWPAWKDSSRAILRLSYSLAISLAVFALVSFATGLGFGWVNAVAIPGEIVTLAPFTLFGTGLKFLLDLFLPAVWGEVMLNVMRVAGLVFAFSIIAWLALGKGRTKPVNLLSWGFLAFAVGNTSLYPWYLTWGGLLLPLTNPSEKTIKTAVVVTAVLLAYGAGNMSYRNGVFALGFAGLGLMLALIWRAVYRRGSV